MDESALPLGTILHGRFRTVSPLNHGSFGLVFRAVDLYTGRPVAIKCLAKHPPTAVAECAEEFRLHRLAGSHPNIVNPLCFFDSDTYMFLVLEFCPQGDLYEAIRLGNEPSEKFLDRSERIRSLMFQLIDAVLFLHSKGIYHRDIKPENLFLDEDGNLKLGDFGLATTESWTYEAAVGSDRYMAPEQFNPETLGYSPAKADAWAVGICLLNLLFARNPFATPSICDPLYADFAADRHSIFDVFPTLSEDSFAVLEHCLAIDPNMRSLEKARKTLEHVMVFTTDGDVLDPLVSFQPMFNVNTERLPLRTPSLAAPDEPQGSFPWASPSMIASSYGESLLSPNVISIASTLDSIANSSDSSSSASSSSSSYSLSDQSSPITESWCDLLDDDEVMSPPSPIATSADSSPRSSLVVDERVSESTGFLFEETDSPCAPPTPDTPSSDPTGTLRLAVHGERKSSELKPSAKRPSLDQWVALGNRRRAAHKVLPATIAEWVAKVEQTARSAPRRVGLDQVTWRSKPVEVASPPPSSGLIPSSVPTVQLSPVTSTAVVQEKEDRDHKRDTEWHFSVDWRKRPVPKISSISGTWAHSRGQQIPSSGIRSGLGAALSGRGHFVNNPLRFGSTRLPSARESPIPLLPGACGQVR
jgi:serine/threonine protein kinase